MNAKSCSRSNDHVKEVRVVGFRRLRCDVEVWRVGGISVLDAKQRHNSLDGSISIGFPAECDPYRALKCPKMPQWRKDREA